MRRTAANISWSDFAKLLDVDLIGAFALSKAAADIMAAHGYGRIIMVTSTSAILGSVADAAYIAAKGGLGAMARALACEYGPLGITCNALCPGPFMTETNANLANHPGIAAWIPTRVPLGRWGRPEEIGPACVFLAAPASFSSVDVRWSSTGGLPPLSARRSIASRAKHQHKVPENDKPFTTGPTAAKRRLKQSRSIAIASRADSSCWVNARVDRSAGGRTASDRLAAPERWSYRGSAQGPFACDELILCHFILSVLVERALGGHLSLCFKVGRD